MKVRFPLYWKILLWLMLNLLFLGVVSYVLVRGQFGLGMEALLAGKAGERVQAVADVIVPEISEKPRSEWDGILKRFSGAYQVQFYLFRNDGAQEAGEFIKLPEEVFKRLTENARMPNPRGQQPLGREGRPPGPEFGGPPPRREGGPPDRLEGPPESGSPGPRGRFMVSTSDPARYWVGVRVRVNDRRLPAPPPMTLIIMSDSIRANGLFFDVVPWIGVGAGVLVVSIIFWFPLVRGITRSISQMTHATEQIAAGKFDVRVEEGRGDELGRLGQAINVMTGRLAGFVAGQKRFLGDTAHELCSPIARIQMALGILEQRANAEQKEYVNDLREEVQHMSSLVNELLSFSRASLEPTAVKSQAVPLCAAIEQAVRRESVAGAEVRVEVPGNLVVLADPELLVRSVGNVIRNAIRYAGHAGAITVSARQETEEKVLISVADCGSGVPEEALRKVFDPFYRIDVSRARETGGIGLGLAIVKTCIESCGGEVACRNREPMGFEVLIKLPSAPRGSAEI